MNPWSGQTTLGIPQGAENNLKYFYLLLTSITCQLISFSTPAQQSQQYIRVF